MERVFIREYKASRDIQLDEKQFYALSHVDKKISVLSAGRPNYYKLQASSWVGELSIPGLHISIQPKISPIDVFRMLIEGDDEAKEFWLPSKATSRELTNVFDLIAKQLIREVLFLLERGINRQYQEIEENSLYFRGQLLFFSDIQKNVPIRTGTFCRYTELSQDTDWNRAINWALVSISHLSSSSIAEELRSLSHYFGGVSFSQACPDFVFPPRSSIYFRALFYVDLFRKMRPSQINAYGLHSEGIFVDMNRVFEGFVREKLRKTLKTSGVKLLNKSEACRSLCQKISLEPDIFGTKNERPVLLGDCKYKENWNYVNTDIYQIMAYLEGYPECKEAFIFYPLSTNNNISIHEAVLPRNRKLITLGIPWAAMFQGESWEKIGNIISERVGK